MAPFAGKRRPSVHLTVGDHGSADPSAQGHQEHVATIDRGAEMKLGKSSHVGIIVDDSGDTEFVLQNAAYRNIGTSHVRSPDKDTVGITNEACDTSTDGNNIVGPQFADCGFGRHQQILAG